MESPEPKVRRVEQASEESPVEQNVSGLWEKLVKHDQVIDLDEIDPDDQPLVVKVEQQNTIQFSCHC